MLASPSSVTGPRKSTLFCTNRSAPPLVMPLPVSVTGSAANSTPLPPPCNSSAAPFATTVPNAVAPSALVPRICSGPAAMVMTLDSVLSLPARIIRPLPRFSTATVPEILPASVRSAAEAFSHVCACPSLRSERIACEPVEPDSTRMPRAITVSALLWMFTLAVALSLKRTPRTVWSLPRLTLVPVIAS